MAVNDKYSYYYNGKEKTGILQELNQDSAIFDNLDVLDRDVFDQQAVNLSKTETEIDDDIDNDELENELKNYEDQFKKNGEEPVDQNLFPTVNLEGGMPVLELETDENAENFEQNNQITKQPVLHSNKQQPIRNVMNPTSALLDKTKKELENVDIKLEIALPSKELFAILNSSLENFETDFLNYIINNLDDDFIKEQIRNSIKRHYNLEV